MGATSIHVQAVKPGSEIHNFTHQGYGRFVSAFLAGDLLDFPDYFLSLASPQILPLGNVQINLHCVRLIRIFVHKVSGPMRNTGRNITASLLLLLFVGYWSSVTLFPHVHRIDGHVFVHSHPFSGSSGNPGHNHTPQQFQLIAHLSLLIATAATFVALVFGQAGAAFVFGVRKPVARRGMPVRVYGLRAPPLD